MKSLIYEIEYCRAFLTNERAESNRSLPVLLVEYADNSPVHPGEHITYGDADLLPSGVSAKAFKERWAPFGRPAPTIGRTAGEIIPPPPKREPKCRRVINWLLSIDDAAKELARAHYGGNVNKLLEELVLEESRNQRLGKG